MTCFVFEFTPLLDEQPIDNLEFFDVVPDFESIPDKMSDANYIKPERRNKIVKPLNCF